MQYLFIGISKYIFIILIAFFVYFSFLLMRDKNGKVAKSALAMQSTMMYLFHLIAFIVLFLSTNENTIIIFYGAQLVFFIIYRGMHTVFYGKKYSKGLMNNMCMLLAIGFVMLTRLYYDKAVKQFFIVCVTSVIALIIPYIVKKYNELSNLTYFYCFAGIAFLSAVLIIGQISGGAKLSVSIAGFYFQPSEFVKILYVFFLAAFLNKSTEFKRVLSSAFFAGFHVIILVLSRDLGSALIFFMVYVVMIYIATGKSRYLFAGAIGGSMAAVIGYKLFSHIRVRVQAFIDPWSFIETGGYQVAQSLFAIGTGGFFGLGLYKGMPKTIPIVEQDFMFSAIAEELGGFFAIFLIILCMSCFMYFIKSALKQSIMFYKLIGVGMSITYAVQTILTIGGAIKFIPSTGVTLPLVSYGGSSVLCTMITFAILQGLFIRAEEERIKNDEQKNGINNKDKHTKVKNSNNINSTTIEKNKVRKNMNDSKIKKDKNYNHVIKQENNKDIKLM